jgi:hypothetical protein
MFGQEGTVVFSSMMIHVHACNSYASGQSIFPIYLVKYIFEREMASTFPIIDFGV